MNRYISGRGVRMEDEESFRRALDKAPVFEGVAHRALMMDDISRLQYRKGNVVGVYAPTSFSKDVSAVGTFSYSSNDDESSLTLITATLKTGADISVDNPQQQEVIARSDTHFKVDSVDFSSTPNRIYLHEVTVPKVDPSKVRLHYSATLLDFDESKHPRDTHGRFGDKGEREPVNERSPKLAVQTKLNEGGLVGAAEQRWCEEHNEPMLAKAVGGVSLRDNEPVDVVVTRGGVVKYGVELKTIVKNVKENPQLAMTASAQERKGQWMRENRADFHTVVFDDRQVFKTGDEAGRQVYYRRGYGAFSLKSMQPVKDMAELTRLIATPTKDLPVAAKPPQSYPRVRPR